MEGGRGDRLFTLFFALNTSTSFSSLEEYSFDRAVSWSISLPFVIPATFPLDDGALVGDGGGRYDGDDGVVRNEPRVAERHILYNQRNNPCFIVNDYTVKSKNKCKKTK